MKLTFRYQVYHDPRVYRPLSDRDDRHFRKYLHHPDVNVYEMNDAMNVLHVSHDHVHDYDVYDVQMNEVNVVDALDVDFVLDVCIFHIQNGFHHRNGDDNVYYMMEVLLQFFVELIVDLNWKYMKITKQ